MHELIQESEVEKAVQIIFDDYNRGKHIDNIDIYNRPDLSRTLQRSFA